MKGIILAGGSGTRLHPATISVSKQLLPIYDKPMVYYPLTTLMLAGIRDIALISTPKDINSYEKLLGDGSDWGIKIEYFVQDKPRGLAHAFIVCEEFIKSEPCCLILGDNIFHGNLRLKEITENFDRGALIFGYPVRDPERYGVISFDKSGRITDIIEKPSNPPSKYAIPGFYYYDNTVLEKVKNLKPSDRNELEITDLNRKYLVEEKLNVQILGRGIAWFDTGTPSSMAKASTFISLVEEIQSYKIGCPEEVALRESFINLSNFDYLLDNMSDNEYKNYLVSIRKEFDNTDNLKHNAIYNLQP